MRELVIYEAGKMSGLTYEEMNSWRVLLKDKLLAKANIVGSNVYVINPIDYYNYEQKGYHSQEEVMDFDLGKVANSDLVVVNLEGLSTSDGTKIELYEAWTLGIPVLAFGKKHVYKKLHPWVKRVITRRDKTMQDTVDYIKDFYMI